MYNSKQFPNKLLTSNKYKNLELHNLTFHIYFSNSIIVRNSLFTTIIANCYVINVPVTRYFSLNVPTHCKSFTFQTNRIFHVGGYKGNY